MPLNDEGAIDGQAEPFILAAFANLAAFLGDGGFQFRHAQAGDRRGADDRRVGEKAVLHHVANFQLHDFASGFIHHVGLGDGDDAVTQAEQFEDFEMFAGLRHDAVVGGHDEQGEIDAGRPGEHVLDEAFVPGNIDDAQAKFAEIEPGEADVDGDAAFFFLGQAIAVDAGEGLDQRGLAVIDMAGGAEDKVARHEVHSCSTYSTVAIQ